MYYKDSIHPLLMFDRGSYFGDISYIFQVRNQYNYFFRAQPELQQNTKHTEPYRLYSLQDRYL